jgi:subtilisin family serine protease
MTTTTNSTRKSRRVRLGASLAALACAGGVLATTFSGAEPTALQRPSPDASAGRSPTTTFGQLDDVALWQKLQASGQEAVVGLKAPKAPSAMRDGAVVIDRSSWVRGRNAVSSSAGVSVLAADDVRPNMTVRFGSQAAMSAVRHLPNVEFLEPRLAPVQPHAPGGGCTGNAYNGDPEGGDVFTGTPATVSPGDKLSANFDNSRVQEAWQRGATGAGVTVGVVDTGVFSTQTQLQPADWNDGMSSGRTLLAIDASGSSTISDECNHGTRIASTIAAPRDGVNMVGVAWKANLVTVKHGADVFIDAFETDAVTRGIRAAANNGARIVEMAFGTGSWQYDNIKQEIQLWNANGVLFVGAAGTEYCLEGVVFPAKMPEVLAVTGATAGGARDPASCGGPEVDLAAVVDSNTFASGRNTNDIITMGGSSGASAVVAGVAALVWSEHPELTKDQVRSRLVGSGSGCCASDIGNGIVNAYKAVGGYNDLSIAGPTTVDPYASYTLTARPQGDGPFTYLWSNGATTPSITATAGGNLTSKTFSVTVRDTRENKTLTASKKVTAKEPIDTCLKYCP